MTKLIKDHEPVISAIAAFVISYIGWLVAPLENVSNSMFFGVCILFVVCLYLFLRERFFLDSKEKRMKFKAKVYSCIDENKILFSVNIDSVLTVESCFLISENINGVETIVALGIIETITEDGLYQANYKFLSGKPHKLNKKLLLIKPTLTEKIINEIY